MLGFCQTSLYIRDRFGNSFRLLASLTNSLEGRSQKKWDLASLYSLQTPWFQASQGFCCCCVFFYRAGAILHFTANHLERVACTACLSHPSITCFPCSIKITLTQLTRQLGCQSQRTLVHTDYACIADFHFSRAFLDGSLSYCLLYLLLFLFNLCFSSAHTLNIVSQNSVSNHLLYSFQFSRRPMTLSTTCILMVPKSISSTQNFILVNRLTFPTTFLTFL